MVLIDTPQFVEAVLMTRNTFSLTVTLVTSAALLLGCEGDPGKPKLGRVSGKVTYNGNPVTKGLVTLVPSSGPGAKTGQSATGEIGSDGSYTLTTFTDGDGAVLGEHVILVQSREEDPAIEGHGMPIPDAQGRVKIKPPKSLVPERYASVDQSPLHFTVKEGDNSPLNIDLKD
jgi:hypothetical protein